MTDVANWYAAGRSGSLSAVATCMRCTPEHAVRLAIRHALARYAITDWSAWKFTAEEFGYARTRVIRFVVDASGQPIRER